MSLHFAYALQFATRGHRYFVTRFSISFMPFWLRSFDSMLYFKISG